MISVVDGGKGLGLGFGGREMEATEVEEGEDCTNQNDIDSTIDPDVALAYIDEKLEHVLGHFQKDFEGGVSAENLGSKFGGYGSFLPTYQRSPVWSHPKTPPKLQNHNASMCPTNLLQEGAHSNFVSSRGSLSVSNGSTPLGMATLPAPRVSSVDGCVKQEVVKPLTNFENVSNNQSYQKAFKVRIKMGSDNLPTKKNADIYGGLGIKVSPISSFKEGPIDGESACELRNSPEVSPTSILEIMTSSPLHGSLLLSPLHDDLICFTDKDMLFQVNKSAPISHKGSQEGSLLSVNASKTCRSDKKFVGEKKPTLSEKVFTMELKNKNGVDVLLKKETDVDNPVCDELVSNALRLSLPSNSNQSVADSAKEFARIANISRIVNKGGTKEESFFNVAKDELHESVSIHENGFVGKSNSKAVSSMKASELKKTYSYDGEYDYLEKGDLKCERIDVSSKVYTDMSKLRKGCDPEFMNHAKHRSGQKSVSSVDNDMKVSSGKETSSSGSKRKSKKDQSHVTHVVTDVRNANTKMDDISAPKSRKSANLSVCMSSSEVDDSKQGMGNAKDRYKEFFGDLELGDNDIAEDIPSVDKLANCAVFEKGNGECTSVSKDRTTTKKIDQASTSEAYTKRSTSLVPPTGNRLISDAAAPVAPLVKEDWVCCDKCQTWRLLPAGKNPDSLPKIWLCSMLDWLDGMNQCTFSEEETTKAVLALHQGFASGLTPAPVYEGQSSRNRYSGVASSGVVDALHGDQSLQDGGGKKKHGFGDVTNASDRYGSSPYSKKKTPQASVKNRSLNGEDNCTLNEADFQVPGHSSGLVEHKCRHKRKEKSKTSANPGAGSVQSDTTGDITSSKIRNKRENSQESYKASKKLKTSGVHIDGDRKSDNGVAALRVGRSLGSILSVNETGKREHKNDLLKDSKVEDRAQLSDARLVHAEYYINGDVKRKINKCQETQLHTTSRSFEGHCLENHRDIMKEISENNHRKGKKQRVSNSGRNDSSMSKESSGIDKKGRSLNNQQEGVNLENKLFCTILDTIDLVKKGVGLTQPPVAATSSTSKVSGSHKSKANLQELKCSVESVSSSPLKISNQDILLSTRRGHGGNNNSKETVILATSSPRKCSDGEDCTRINQSSMIQENLIINTMNNGCTGSSMLYFQDKNQSNIPRTSMAEFVSSPEFATHHVTDALQSDQYPCKPLISNEESGTKIHDHISGSSRQSGKGSSLRCKDKSRGSRSEYENGNLKSSEINGYADHSSHGQNSKARSKLQEKSTLNSEKVEKTIFRNKDPVESPTDIGKIEAQSGRGSLSISDIRQVVSNHDSKQNLPMDCSSEKDSKRFPSEKTYPVDISGKGKSHSLPPSGRGQNEMTRWPQPINGIPKDSGVNVSTVSTNDGDTPKSEKQIKKSENQSGNGMMPINSQNPINSHKGRDIDAPSAIRRDSSSQAATNALKEAKDLKHLADRYKNSGSTLDSTGLYFQAALKFLYGASLLESCNSDNAKHGEMIQSMQIYSDTAKLCEFCAHEYEKSKDMASAALAYKCVEVAYLRVINSARTSASKDRQELQTTLQIVLSGESPSSSASDVDNLNNPAMVEKITLNKGVNSAQIAGNHVIPARNRPNFLRLLNFAQDVNFAMEASRKSRTAFTAVISSEDTKYRESVPSVKKALDFNFHDVEGLLLLVRLAMEAISH